MLILSAVCFIASLAMLYMGIALPYGSVFCVMSCILALFAAGFLFLTRLPNG
jgi:hypothetical protein